MYQSPLMAKLAIITPSRLKKYLVVPTVVDVVALDSEVTEVVVSPTVVVYVVRVSVTLVVDESDSSLADAEAELDSDSEADSELEVTEVLELELDDDDVVVTPSDPVV